MPATPVDPQALRYRNVVAHGIYEPQFQILIDNRTHHGQAGYHVITPLRLAGSELRVLVNRGWVPALAEHRLVPQVSTPSGTVEVSGMAIVPATPFFTLGENATNDPRDWQSVWQNLDLARYEKAVSFPIQPVPKEDPFPLLQRAVLPHCVSVHCLLDSIGPKRGARPWLIANATT